MPEDEVNYCIRRDICTSLLVCKSWSTAARHVLGPGRTIRVDEDQLSRLYNDVIDLSEEK